MYERNHGIELGKERILLNINAVGCVSGFGFGLVEEKV